MSWGETFLLTIEFTAYIDWYLRYHVERGLLGEDKSSGEWWTRGYCNWPSPLEMLCLVYWIKNHVYYTHALTHTYTLKKPKKKKNLNMCNNFFPCTNEQYPGTQIDTSCSSCRRYKGLDGGGSTVLWESIPKWCKKVLWYTLYVI